MSSLSLEAYAQRVVAQTIVQAETIAMKHVRRIRQARGLTQADLAEAVGCNQATISKLERGTFKPTLDLIDRIAARLGVNPVELFALTELEQRFLEALRQADPARRQAVLLLLEGGTTPGEGLKPPRET